MSDRVNDRVNDRVSDRSWQDLRSPAAWRRIGLEAAGVLVVFAAAGFGAGWLWERIWTPNTGVAINGEYLSGFRPSTGGFSADYAAERRDFDAIAIYFVIGLLAALVLGALCAVVARRAALVTLVAVLLGSVLAALIAYRFGVHLGPPDPDPIAAKAADGTALRSSLVIQGKSPYLAWPIGALVGLMFVNFLTSGGPPSRRIEASEPLPQAAPDPYGQPPR